MEEKPPMSEQESAAIAPPPPAPVARGRVPWTMLILLALAFFIGVALTIWAMPFLQKRWGSAGSQVRTAAALPGGAATSGSAMRPLSADAAQVLDGRVAQLEERLSRITVEAQAASGYATRAEGLLVAFAARRALDNGAPLGYVEGQLRLRFGSAQPRAVATIINAAREPVTLADLRGGLAGIASEVVSPPRNASWWEALEHEARELITIHRASTPSPRPQAAMERAVRYMDGSRVDAALSEVERMPDRATADRWMQMARRYLEARRALDLIETAAILEPRPLQSAQAGAANLWATAP
jgi:outer membrane murein-binding lipoprotein Lpp